MLAITVKEPCKPFRVGDAVVQLKGKRLVVDGEKDIIVWSPEVLQAHLKEHGYSVFDDMHVMKDGTNRTMKEALGLVDLRTLARASFEEVFDVKDLEAEQIDRMILGMIRALGHFVAEVAEVLPGDE